MVTGIRAAVLVAIAFSLASLLANAHAVAQEDGGTLEEVRNYHQISTSLLTAGQIYPKQIPELQSKSVELVINLAVADPERNAEEAFAVAEAGMSYVNIPVPWDNPGQADLQLFFDVMDARRERVAMVHCFANFRASAFTFLYRVIREGVPVEVARKDLLAVWDEEAFDSYPLWRTFIDETLATHGKTL